MSHFIEKLEACPGCGADKFPAWEYDAQHCNVCEYVHQGSPAMQITLTPTDTIQSVDGVPMRKWQGTTARGVPVVAFIRAIQPQTHDAEKLADFERELQALPQPKKEPVSFDMRFAI